MQGFHRDKHGHGEDVARASFLPRVQLAFGDIAHSDAGTIAVRYPQLAPIALTLEQDSTAAEVQQTFMESQEPWR